MPSRTPASCAPGDRAPGDQRDDEAARASAAPGPRETTEDTELLGHRVPARTRVVINAWAIGRDPAAWERAEEFVPERFVGGVGTPPVEYSYSKVGVGQDFRSVAFGAGRRGCRAGFAAPTVELALANLLYHFDWAAPTAHRSGVGTPPVDVSEVYGLSVRLKTPLILVAKPWLG